MPRFELSVIFRLLERENKINVLKNTVKYLIDNGYNVRKLQSLGDRGLPVKMYKEDEIHYTGSYMLYDVDFRDEDFPSVKRFFQSHTDVLRFHCSNHAQLYAPEPPCDGMQPIDYAAKLEELKKGKKKNLSYMWKKKVSRK